VTLPNGVAFQINYLSDRVQLNNVIPEPTTLTMLALTSIALLRRRRADS
jgi:hypothetical protein